MKRLSLLITAVLILISAAALTEANSRVKINYCKGTVRYNGGLAVLKEDSVSAAVITLDDSGGVTGRANILLNDPFGLSVKSVHDLFFDDNGDLYFFCTVYGLKASDYPRYEELYRCNFTLGSVKKLWSSKKLSGYELTPGSVPYVDGSDIYIPMTAEKSGSVDILKFSKDGSYTAVIEDCDDLSDGYDSDTVIYRNGTVFRAKDTDGVFVNGEPVFSDPDAYYDALSLDNGILSFIDFTADTLYHYDVSSKAVSQEKLSPVFADSSDSLQNLHVSSDGTVTASFEDGEALRAYSFRGEREDVYSLVRGGLFLRSFLIFLVLSSIAAAVLWLLYTLLFVRIRIRRQGARRYQSIAARVTALSTAAGIICAAVFGVLINGTVERLNGSLQNSINANGSQFLAGYIFTDCRIEAQNGLPVLDEQSSEALSRAVESCQTSLYETNRIDCSFILFAESNGRLYRAGDKTEPAVPAEYVVSIRAAGLIQNSIQSGVNCVFEDKMTTGCLKYTCTNFPIFGVDGTLYNGVLCAVTDMYRTRQTAFVLHLWLVAVIFLLVVILLAAANIVLHCSLSKLRRLSKAFGLYEKNGDPSVFLLGENNDEITETGRALMLMTEGAKVRARDIGDGNRKYKRFMAAGILRLLNRSEVSKVNFGDCETENALILRFTAENSDISQYAEQIGGFLEKTDCVLLNFGSGRADVCCTNEDRFTGVIKAAVNSGYPSPILITCGKIECGSAGSSNGAWLIALSEEFSELEKIPVHAEKGTVLCTEKLAQGIALPGLELRRRNGYYELITDRGEYDESENYDNNIAASDGGSLDPVL